MSFRVVSPAEKLIMLYDEELAGGLDRSYQFVYMRPFLVVCRTHSEPRPSKMTYPDIGNDKEGEEDPR